MSALLLGATVGSLSKSNQSILVWFVVLFPVAVLAAFLWLVAKHHRKLYSPSDFRSDEGFLAQPAEPQHLGARLAFEIDEIASEIEQAEEPAEAQPAEVEPHPPTTVQPEGRAAAVATAYLAESLAFRELDREFPGQIRQHVRVKASDGRYVEIDGLIETDTVKYIVEVKFVSKGTRYERRIRDAIEHISQGYIHHNGLLPGSTKAILIIITGDGVPSGEVAGYIESARGRSSLDISYRVYEVGELLARYGFPA